MADITAMADRLEALETLVAQLQEEMADISHKQGQDETRASQNQPLNSAFSAEAIKQSLYDEIQENIGDLVKEAHPEFAQFLDLFEGQNGIDIQGLATLISGGDDDVSDQHFEKVLQNVRLAIQDMIQQQVTSLLRHHLL